jgi:hypothetical protein
VYVWLIVDHHQAPDQSRSDFGVAFVIQEMQRVSIGMHANYRWGCPKVVFENIVHHQKGKCEQTSETTQNI